MGPGCVLQSQALLMNHRIVLELGWRVIRWTGCHHGSWSIDSHGGCNRKWLVWCEEQDDGNVSPLCLISSFRVLVNQMLHFLMCWMSRTQRAYRYLSSGQLLVAWWWVSDLFELVEQVNVTADHRIIYGGDLAVFLQTLAAIIEDPKDLTL